MAPLVVGEHFPEDVHFGYIPFDPENTEIKSCGIPQKLDFSKEIKHKKVVLISVPGAFTPTCQADHLPGFVKGAEALKKKGVDKVVVIAYNDPFVMSAWGKANDINDDFIIFATDEGSKFSQSIGWPLGDTGRTGRYAVVIDYGKITYAEKEPAGGVTVSGYDAVLARL